MEGEGMRAEEAARFEADRQTLERFRGLVSDGNIILGTLGFGLRIDRSVPTLAFDHRRREVLVNPDFIERKGLTPEQQRYVFGHEIAHFVQLVQDPETYLATFKAAEDRSKVHEGEDIQPAVQQAWNSFFNVFLDVHDNAIVDERSMWTQALPPEKHPRRTLYLEKMVDTDDLRDGPKTEQFNFALLKRVMTDVEHPIRVDDDVAELIDKPFKYMGKTFSTLAHFVRSHFYDPKLPLSVWFSKLDRTLAPMYKELLRKDVESGAIKNQKRVVELTGDPQEGGDIKKVVDEIKKSREKSTDRAKRKDGESYGDKLRENGFSEADIATMLQIREKSREVIPTLVDLWDAFIQKSVVSDIVKEGWFVTGEEVDVDAFVRELPTLFTHPDRARFMDRSVNEPIRETERPQAIDLYFILDLSGSMDKDKRDAVQAATYSLAKSLLQYQRNKINALDDPSREVLDVNLRQIGFGTTMQDLFMRTPGEEAAGALNVKDPEELEIRLARAILDIRHIDLGGTDDTSSLASVLADVERPEKKKQFASGNGVAVVLEMTDGETQNPTSSRLSVQQLNGQPNVFARGIKIPGSLHADVPPKRDPDHPEQDAEAHKPIESTGAFEQVWGEHGERLEDLSRLRDVMLKVLFEALRQKQRVNT